VPGKVGECDKSKGMVAVVVAVVEVVAIFGRDK
jgi:hypothetical protein